MADIKGYFIVNKNNALSSDVEYALAFLKDRMLFLKIGGQFTSNAMKGAILGGAIGSMIGSAMDKGKKNIKDEMAQKMLDLAPEELMRLDKKNFELPYEQISKVEFKKGGMNWASGKGRSGSITMELIGKKPEKYDLSNKSDFDESLKLMQNIMPGKVG